MNFEHRQIIPQTDPRANYLTHRFKIDAAIARVLDAGSYILGQEVESFENEFASYVGVNYATGVANGTEALYLAQKACNIGSSDIVFTVSHTAVATIAAIEMTGAIPFLVDIDPKTFTMDPNRLEDILKDVTRGRISCIKGNPKAILPVHIYGHPADLSAILEIASRYGLYVIEDCAQSLGASIEGRKTGSWGCISAFSFYPTKNLGALGDGGMVVTNDPYLSERVCLLRQYGWRNRYISEMAGINSRLDELQAAILRVKLPYLEQENERRCEVARIYKENLSNTPLILPQCLPANKHVYHQYVVRTYKRDSLKAHLQKRGIGTLVHYPVPIHLQPAYLNICKVHDKLPITEQVASEILSLPIFPELSDEEIKSIIESIQVWINSETRNK
jgi:dTDP-4-amino-4,6-dideoxygalactose transaminase